jgi:hypothetical protein
MRWRGIVCVTSQLSAGPILLPAAALDAPSLSQTPFGGATRRLCWSLDVVLQGLHRRPTKPTLPESSQPSVHVVVHGLDGLLQQVCVV